MPTEKCKDCELLLQGLNTKEQERREHRNALQAWANDYAVAGKPRTHPRDVLLFDACMSLGLRVPLRPDLAKRMAEDKVVAAAKALNTADVKTIMALDEALLELNRVELEDRVVVTDSVSIRLRPASG